LDQAAAKLERADTMALQAKRSHVRKIAFATPFDHRNDMVGVPQTLSATEVPFGGCAAARVVTQLAEMDVSRNTIHAAERANSAISFKDFLSEVAGIGTQLPLVDAPIRAKR
jgi:hypothetical protein